MDDRFAALRSEAAPFVGREEELDLLLRRWRQIPEQGGKAVLVSGEPGMGKSRLLAVARDRIAAGDPQPQFITYFCSQNFANTALYPIIRQIGRSCQLTASDIPEVRRRKLDELLGAVSSPEALALLTDLLSLDCLDGPDPISHLSPAERRKATFAILVRHLTSLAAGRRLIIAFEDIHWADPSTLELIDLLIAQIEAHPILLVATYRPEFQPSWAGQEVSIITLSRLPTTQRRRLIEAVAGPGTLSREVVDEIAERTDGVPLFVEELTKATIEAGGTDQAPQVRAPSSPIPATLHASLMARLDRLGLTARQVAQTAAVIGREFTAELLRRVWTRDPRQMKTALDQLLSAGLIFARGGGDHTTYVFKHALVQDAAYSSLLRGQKQSLHRSIAAHLAERSGADKLAELIARHYREARDSLLAAEWRLKAGEASNQHGAFREAVENLRAGLTDASLLPDTTDRKELELKLNVALSLPLIAFYSFTSGQTAEVVDRAEALSLALAKPQPAPLLSHRAMLHFGRGDYTLSIPVARELEESMGDHSIALRGSVQRTFAEMMLGADIAAAKENLETCFQKLLRYGPEIDHLRFAYTYDFKVATVPALCMALWNAGYPDQALGLCDFGRQRAAEIRDWMGFCQVCSWAIICHELRGDISAMDKTINEFEAAAKRESLSGWSPLIKRLRAIPTAFRGEVDTGLLMFDEAGAVLDNLKLRVFKTYFLGVRARILGFAGRDGEALVTIEQALAVARSSDEKVHISDLRRVRGDLLLRQGGRNFQLEAEQEFREAIAFARKQNALSYELRAAHSLANLMRRRGDEASALQLLEPVFDRFTEGFDTADLIAARETIDELKQQTGVPPAGSSVLNTARRDRH
jgi:tetratricopeptide (TPR) repeat protein